MACEDEELEESAPVAPLRPDGCQHYDNLSEVPWDIHKYFHQRYSLFSKYEEGIWMTEDAWFGATPEPVASKIAQHIATAAPSGKAVIIDCFAGVGGNVIAFAQDERWTRVYAVEKDAASLKCARHNAQVYGVEDKIAWYLGDCFEVLRNELKDLGPHCIIFASPPWGGPNYRSDAIFDLRTMQPYALSELMDLFHTLTHEIVLYLPRTSDVRQLAQYANSHERVTIMHYCMEGASKALCAFFGGMKLPLQGPDA